MILSCLTIIIGDYISKVISKSGKSHAKRFSTPNCMKAVFFNLKACSPLYQTLTDHAGFHMDFRPGNILVNGNEVAGIIDFESARGGSSEIDFTKVINRFDLCLLWKECCRFMIFMMLSARLFGVKTGELKKIKRSFRKISIF